MKKYRIRPCSPIWWARGIVLGIMSVASFYGLTLIMWMVEV